MSVEIKNLSHAQTQNTRDTRESQQTRNHAPLSPGTDSLNKASIGSGSGGDTVTLTSTAKRLSDLQQGIAAQPVVNEDKVAKIREALAEGRYKIDPERIAERLINFEEF